VEAAGPRRRAGRVRRRASPAGPGPMLSFARDLPNVCTLAGLFAAVLGLYFALRGIYPAAVIALLWATVFDWSDGLIARRMKGRTADQRAIGAQLDSLVDIVSFSVAPALLLLSVGHFSPWFIPGAFVILATGVIRLSYFNVFGLLNDSTYRGLALDNNLIVLALLFVFEPVVGIAHFAVVLYLALMMLAALNVAPIQTPKLGGRWYYAVILYALALTGVYGWQLA
jgi:phosphatidylserine synthase